MMNVLKIMAKSIFDFSIGPCPSKYSSLALINLANCIYCEFCFRFVWCVRLNRILSFSDWTSCYFHTKLNTTNNQFYLISRAWGAGEWGTAAKPLAGVKKSSCNKEIVNYSYSTENYHIVKRNISTSDSYALNHHLRGEIILWISIHSCNGYWRGKLNLFWLSFVHMYGSTCIIIIFKLARNFCLINNNISGIYVLEKLKW